MALFGGGSAQGVNTFSSQIDFTPTINVGEKNTSEIDKTQSATQSVVPKFDDSTTLAASVGAFGGTGGTASAQKQTIDDAQPTDTFMSTGGISSLLSPRILLLSVLGIGIFYFVTKRKGR